MRVRKDLWLTFHLEEIGSRGAGNIQSKQLKEDFGKYIKVYETKIPMAIKVAESSSLGKSVLSYDKNGKVAEAYCSIAKEVLDNNAKDRKKNAVVNECVR